MQYWGNICLHVYSPICCQNAVICGNLLTVFFLQSAKVGFVNSRILYIYAVRNTFVVTKKHFRGLFRTRSKHERYIFGA